VPIGLLMRLSYEGIAVAAIGEETGTVLQTMTRQAEGEFQAHWLAIWNVDMLQDEAAQRLCDMSPLTEIAPLDSIESARSNKLAWIHANDEPTRDRLGPAALLDMIEEVWSEVSATTEGEEEDIGLREVLAQDLFRMGNVLQRLGILRVAAEHHGTSYLLSPSPEAACYLGMTFSSEEEDGLAWQRKAIETNPNYGGSWNEIGESLLQRGEAERAIEWFRGAINSMNYCERGAAWANLARAHLELGQSTSALFAAQEAASLMPEEEELDELLEQLGEALV
jgi:tetratricopeptide (TPR) repeat protein